MNSCFALLRYAAAARGGAELRPPSVAEQWRPPAAATQNAAAVPQLCGAGNCGPGAGCVTQSARDSMFSSSPRVEMQ